MGRIINRVKVANVLDPKHEIEFSALVDTGAAPLVLPMAWKEKLGPLRKSRDVIAELGNPSRVSAEIHGPVEITIEGFKPIFSEVMFLEMENDGEEYEPLLGHLPLQAAGIAVDMLGRLFDEQRIDVK